MAKLNDVANAMFRNRSNWNNISDDEKSEFFFIFNRYFSKKYPEKAQLLNIKGIDKVACMNLWFHFMYDKPYPDWFWSKNTKESDKDKEKISDKDIKLLMIKMNITEFDLLYLLDHYTEFVLEELKYYKSLEKNHKNDN